MQTLLHHRAIAGSRTQPTFRLAQAISRHSRNNANVKPYDFVPYYPSPYTGGGRGSMVVVTKDRAIRVVFK